MRRLLTKLSQSSIVRGGVRALQLHKLGNAWLRRFPMVKRLPGSGVIYRASRLESIPLAVEMFEKENLYDRSLLPPAFETFADLGCNVGYFTCWLAHLASGRPLKGLMLDANPSAVDEARWHAQANEWPQVHALHGIAGEGQPGDSRDFHLYESNICSTSHLPDVEAMGLKGKWETIQVPCLNIGQAWRSQFGDTRCHLLKLDIEGSEGEFLKTEEDFLSLVDCLIVEWHAWRVTLPDLKQILEPAGFRYLRTIEEQDQMGTAFFRRES